MHPYRIKRIYLKEKPQNFERQCVHLKYTVFLLRENWSEILMSYIGYSTCPIAWSPPDTSNEVKAKKSGNTFTSSHSDCLNMSIDNTIYGWGYKVRNHI